MMSFTLNKTLIHAVLAGLLMMVVSVAQAWVTPVDMDADHTGLDAKNTVNTTLGSTFDRCDTSLALYPGSGPAQCHRRNLIWRLDSSVELVQWNPELGEDADWRLPTIKELSRLVNYASNDALAGQPLIQNMFTNFEFPISWLISSSHRDIDGVPNNGEAQIFGLNMGTGEIAAFDTVLQNEFTTFEETSNSDFAVGDEYESIENTVEGITTTTIKTVSTTTDEGDGTFTIRGDVTFTATANVASTIGDVFQTTGSTGGDPMVTIKTVTQVVDEGDGTFTISGDVTTQIVEFKKCDSLNASGACATSSNANVYALLVHTQTVSELLIP